MNLDILSDKFEELEAAIADRMQAENEHRKLISIADQKILRLKGEAGMALAMAKQQTGK